MALRYLLIPTFAAMLLAPEQKPRIGLESIVEVSSLSQNPNVEIQNIGYFRSYAVDYYNFVVAQNKGIADYNRTAENKKLFLSNIIYEGEIDNKRVIVEVFKNNYGYFLQMKVEMPKKNLTGFSLRPIFAYDVFADYGIKGSLSTGRDHILRIDEDTMEEKLWSFDGGFFLRKFKMPADEMIINEMDVDEKLTIGAALYKWPKPEQDKLVVGGFYQNADLKSLQNRGRQELRTANPEYKELLAKVVSQLDKQMALEPYKVR